MPEHLRQKCPKPPFMKPVNTIPFPSIITTPFTMLELVTTKELANLLNVSVRTAQKFKKDIKEEYKIQHVTRHHVNKYFKIA